MAGKITILFKTRKLERQWKVLLMKNPELVHRVMDYAEQIPGHSITITEILRTKPMQRRYYPNEPDKISVHQYWRGVDVSIKEQNRAVAESKCSMLNKLYPYDQTRPSLVTYLIHDIGQGSHLHCQTL